MRQYWFAITRLLIGVSVAIWGPLTPSGKGVILGGVFAYTLIELVVRHFGHLTVAEVLPRNSETRRKLVVSSGLLSTGVVLVSLNWLITNLMSENQSAFAESLVFAFFLVLGLWIEIAAASVALMRGGFSEESE